MNLKQTIRRILREELNEIRVPRSERVELYKDDNIIVVVPLTHRALKKYAHQCQWCINDDLSEWEDYHKGRHVVIIQRNPKKPKIGITNYPIPSEIFTIDRYADIDSIYDVLSYKFSSNEERDDYMDEVTSNINNFATNIVYYSPSNSLYDQEDNYLPQYGYKISDIPNVTSEVIEIMDEYLTNSEDGDNIEESILREESKKKQRVFYGFSGIKNNWVDDNDRNVDDSYFDDKDYEEYYFDNFYDMDMMFGHKHSLFGTRGLEPGDPNRSSKSFDMYNKEYGPMIVRVI